MPDRHARRFGSSSGSGSSGGREVASVHRAQLPDFRPRKYGELVGAGISRKDQAANYVCLGKGVYLHRAYLPEPQKYPPTYCLDPITRARAFHLQKPTAVASHMTALSLNGLRYFRDQPTCFRTSDRSSGGLITPSPDAFSLASQPGQSSRWLHLQKTRLNALPTHCPDPAFPALHACTLPVALAQCLSALENQSPQVHNLGSHMLPGYSDTFVSQVQLCDAVLFLLKATGPRDVDWSNLSRQADQELLARILENSDPGSQSPPETLMRLAVKDILNSAFPNTKFHIYTQVGLLFYGQRETVLDLLLVERGSPADVTLSSVRPIPGEVRRELELKHAQELLKGTRHLALQYDGEHHLRRSQRDLDTRIGIMLEEHGLVVQRLTAGILREYVPLQEILYRKLRP